MVRSSKPAIPDTENRFIAAQSRFMPSLKDGKLVYSQMTREFAWRLETVARQRRVGRAVEATDLACAKRIT